MHEAIDEGYKEEGDCKSNCKLEEAALEAPTRAVDGLSLATEDASHACAFALHHQDQDKHNRQYELNNVESVPNFHRIYSLRLK